MIKRKNTKNEFRIIYDKSFIITKNISFSSEHIHNPRNTNSNSFIKISFYTDDRSINFLNINIHDNVNYWANIIENILNIIKNKLVLFFKSNKNTLYLLKNSIVINLDDIEKYHNKELQQYIDKLILFY